MQHRESKAWITDEILHHICKILQNSCHIKLKQIDVTARYENNAKFSVVSLENVLISSLWISLNHFNFSRKQVSKFFKEIRKVGPLIKNEKCLFKLSLVLKLERHISIYCPIIILTDENVNVDEKLKIQLHMWNLRLFL